MKERWIFWRVTVKRGSPGYEYERVRATNQHWPLGMFTDLAIRLGLMEYIGDKRCLEQSSEYGPMKALYWQNGQGLMCLPGDMHPRDIF